MHSQSPALALEILNFGPQYAVSGRDLDQGIGFRRHKNFKVLKARSCLKLAAQTLPDSELTLIHRLPGLFPKPDNVIGCRGRKHSWFRQMFRADGYRGISVLVFLDVHFSRRGRRGGRRRKGEGLGLQRDSALENQHEN
jgi:hypothetical protein